MKTQPKFICENCQNVVPANAKFCPKCGRFFAAVKCPRCGKVGNSQLFKNGCPQCGYSEGKTEISKQEIEKIDKILKKQKKRRAFSEDSLPVWVYIVAFASLAVLIVLFILMF